MRFKQAAMKAAQVFYLVLLLLIPMTGAIAATGTSEFAAMKDNWPFFAFYILSIVSLFTFMRMEHKKEVDEIKQEFKLMMASMKTDFERETLLRDNVIKTLEIKLGSATSKAKELEKSLISSRQNLAFLMGRIQTEAEIQEDLYGPPNDQRSNPTD